MYRAYKFNNKDENRNEVKLIHHIPKKKETVPTLSDLQFIRKLSLGDSPKRDSLEKTEYHRFSSPPSWLVPWPNYEKLPHLPVPPLSQTVQKFLEYSQVLNSHQDHEALQQSLKEFLGPGGTGRCVQRLLELRASVQDNWLSAWWLDAAYLERRVPLPVNVSPFILFPPKLFEPTIDGQVRWTSKLVVAVLKYRELILARKLAIDKVGGGATMDMSQYDWLFGTYRVPGQQKDLLHLGNQNSMHIIVTRNGHFYFVPVFDENGEIISERKVAKRLLTIFDRAAQLAEHKVGLLTTEKRGVWAGIYEKIRKGSKDNEIALDAIENSLFILCMNSPADNYAPKLSDWVTYGHELLLETASSKNFGNRWYDKTLQFVVGTNGTAGVVYEHSPVEGIPVCALMDFVLEHINHGDPEKLPNEERPEKEEEYIESITNLFPRCLRFHLGEEEIEALHHAGNNMNELAKNFELKIFTFREFGKNFPKSQKMSPDSFIQVAIQLAYFTLHGEHVAQYESGTLRKFKLGRTDVIRMPNNDSKSFVLAMRSHPPISNSEKGNLLKAAVESHKKFVGEVCGGNGIDRHLLGLKLTAKENGLKIPEFFNLPGFGKLMNFKVATSQLPCKHDAIMAFGPSVPNGYGVCYNPLEECIHFQITANNQCGETCGEKYQEMLGRCLMEMKNVLCNGEE